MKKLFLTKLFIPAAIIAALICGCNSNSLTTVNTTTDQEATTAEESGYPAKDSELIQEELTLGIDTLDKRLQGLNDLGEEAYWFGVYTSGNYIQTQTCEGSPITNTIEEAYPGYVTQDVKLMSSYDGHMIPVDYVLANGKEDNSTVIFIHGASENRRNFTDVTALYLERGYNVLVYDQQSSGENTAPYCTYGYLEQKDLVQCMQYIETKLSDDKKIILYARSQGGCTAGRVLGSDYGNKTIDAAILDCPLASMRKILETYIGDRIPAGEEDKYFNFGDKVLSYYIDGFTMARSEMTDYVKNTTVPTFVITSDGDTVVDKSMPIAIYDAIPGVKKLYVSKIAYHCWIYKMEPDIYKQQVDDFLNGVL